MDRHVANAQKAAEFLETHPKVAWVTYPGLRSHPDYARAKKYMPKGPGAILGFGVKGGFEAGKKFIEPAAVQPPRERWRRQEPGHPSRQHHPRQLSPEEQSSAGVTPDFIRLSIGIEDIEDILGDLDQALAKPYKRVQEIGTGSTPCAAWNRLRGIVFLRGR